MNEDQECRDSCAEWNEIHQERAWEKQLQQERMKRVTEKEMGAIKKRLPRMIRRSRGKLFKFTISSTIKISIYFNFIIYF